MKTDIEIAQEAVMEPITKVAESIGIEADDLELYGKYKAKLSEEFLRKIQDRPNGKLILVTAINPTPAGEGKTTTTVGMGEAFGRMGKKAVIALREPSLGPCFGIKGGAAGGGYAQVVPMDELNLHFTGDFHAITSANNLLAALLDNHIQQGNDLGIDTRQIVWKRCEDMNDRVLRNIVVGLGNKTDGFVREDHFVITVASEIMAILCLADDMKDLKERLSRIVVAYNYQGEPVTAGAVMVDGLGVGDVGNVVLRDRKHLSEDGLVIIVATVDSKTGKVLAGPDLVSRGFVYVRENESLMDGAQSIVENALDRCVDEHVRDWNSVKTRVREALSSYIYRRTKRSPMILPILMEV